MSTSSADQASSSSTTSSQTLDQFVSALAAKQPTPGGGAAAAVGAAVGSSAAQMAAQYTQRKKDVESGAAAKAQALIETLSKDNLLARADDDAKAYADLQSTWKKDHGLTEEQITQIQATALMVPTELVVDCHSQIVHIQEFLPHCNPNITSDAKVGIHQLAGAARAAYQTVLVNSPPAEHKERLVKLLREIQDIEAKLLELD